MTTPPRLPRSFNLNTLADEQPKDKKSESKKKPATRSRKPKTIAPKAVLKPVPDIAAQRFEPNEHLANDIADELTPPPAKIHKKRFKWGRLFWLALSGLISLGVGLWIDQLVRELFSRQDWLGWVALSLTAVIVIAAFAIVARELWGLSRMTAIAKLRDRTSTAILERDTKSAKDISAELLQLYADRPDMARGREIFQSHQGEIIDSVDLLGLAERDLMTPLDRQARALVMSSAKRVSVVTAVSPRAIVDIAYVLLENTRLIRRLADLYGGRPGTLGFWRLARNVIGHLAVTGTIAVGDGLVQQIVGQGLAAKLSSRLGEGVVNGLLTARIGISAIDLCRPMPFSERTRPTVKDFLGDLLKFSENETQNSNDK